MTNYKPQMQLIKEYIYDLSAADQRYLLDWATVEACKNDKVKMWFADLAVAALTQKSSDLGSLEAQSFLSDLVSEDPRSASLVMILMSMSVAYRHDVWKSIFDECLPSFDAFVNIANLAFQVRDLKSTIDFNMN